MKIQNSRSEEKHIVGHSRKVLKECHCGEKEPIVYVQAGTSTSMGTRRSPFSTLAQAQSYGKWTTLIVLYSPTPLDGGITLRDGQRLIGDRSGLMPIISNTGSDNGGNAVVCNGNNCIKNLHFKNIVASAINYNMSRDLCVKNCLIEQYNTSLINTSYVVPEYNQYLQVAAIEGYNSNSGRALFKNIVVRNNVGGDAIHDFQYGGAHRKLSVINSEFTQLKAFNADESLFPAFNAIFTSPFDNPSKNEVYLNNNFFHDFLMPIYPYVTPTITAIRIMAFNGGQNKSLVKHSRFQNLNPDSYSENGVRLLTIQTEAVTNNKVSQIPSKLIYAVEECEFYETVQFATTQTLTTVNEASSIVYAFKQNIIINSEDGVLDFILGSGTTNCLVEENYAETWDSFYEALTYHWRYSPPTGPVIQISDLRKNKVFGSQNGGFIGVFPGDDGSAVAYDELLINLEKNCFEGVFYGEGGTVGIGVFVGDFYGGNIVIQGSENNIVGTALNILDINSYGSFILQENYWGPGNSCSSPTDCNFYQICHEGMCTGPQDIYTTGGSMIDVSSPLYRPIKCYELESNFDIDSAHSTNNYKQLHLHNKRNPQHQTRNLIAPKTITPKQEAILKQFSERKKFIN